MQVAANYSPVLLSYIPALRGVKPRRPGEPFAYASFNCLHPHLMIGLAASNPEGRFFCFVNDPALCEKAQQEARARNVSNVSILCASPRDAVARLGADPAFLPPLDYLVCDESELALAPVMREALFELAAMVLAPGGLLADSYRVLQDADSALRFLVREFAPEMSAAQASEFLLEIKTLGKLYFRERADVAARLDQAIARGVPDEFFEMFDARESRSTTFETIVALRPRGFAYAGDTTLSANYVEMSVPPEAQEIVVNCRSNPLYEPIKDFVLNRAVRNDIWCRLPAAMSDDQAELLGGFAYGITTPRDKIPAQLDMQGKSIDLDTPVYRALIAVLSMLPAGIGDLIAYPDCKGLSVEEIVEAVQVLVACGVARPMRGAFGKEDAANVGSIAQPRLVGSYNRYLDTSSVTAASLLFASPILGDVVSVPAREALVMLALDRAGLANSPHALLQELQRLAQSPSVAARIPEMAEPTPEAAQRMIEEEVSKNIVQWYAYGLLEAA